MNHKVLAFIGSVILLSSCQKEEQVTTATPSKPNVLIILSDDQGTLDLNSYGSTDLETPNLDRLATFGVRFTQFYAVAPVCSPSRAGLLTGRYNYNAGLYGNVDIPDHDPEGKSGMPTEQITMAELFKPAGYRTATIGKWHLGHSPENDKEIYRPGEFFGDLMVDEVKQFSQPSADPFFIYWAINMPHYPYQGRPGWLEHYKDMPSPRREYAAFISTLDELVGNVLDHLEQTGQLENTIIVFQADHGHSTEERAYFGGGNAGPFNGAKFSMLEGGIRVPAIISWPGGDLPKGQVRNQWAGSVDWFPTLADLTGVDIPNPTEMDGISLRDVIYNNAASGHDVMHWATGNPEAMTNSWAVRKGPWKLLGNPQYPAKKLTFTEDDKLYLVNLSQDSTESKNLRMEHPEVAAELMMLHEDWLKDVLDNRSKLNGN